MSQVEQKLENRVELPEKEDVERVAYCAGVYLSAFSKEPFNEKWSIDGKESSGFLLNPKTTGDFVKEVFNQSDLEITKTSEGGENIKVNKDLIVEHIDKTLASPMTEHFVETNWIGPSEIEELGKLGEEIANRKNPYLEIYTPYPITDIVNSYVETAKIPESLVILGYQEGLNFNTSENKVQFLRVQPDTQNPEEIYPRVVGRYLTLNSPKSKEPKKDSKEIILKEVGHYFDNKEITQVEDLIDPDRYTIYLGEVAKIGTFSKNFRAIYLTGLEYLKILTSESEEEIKFDADHLIPEQMVYFSLEGTAVATRENNRPSESKLFTVLKELLDSFDVKHEEKILEFQKPNNKKVVLGVINKIK